MNRLEGLFAVIILLLAMFGFIVMKKYILLREAYQKAETEKVFYCKENREIKQIIKECYERSKLNYKLQ